MVYMFDRNSGGKASQVEFKSNLRSFGYFECSAKLWLLWTQAAKAPHLQELVECFWPRLSPVALNRAFVNNGSCIQIVDTTLIT